MFSSRTIHFPLSVAMAALLFSAGTIAVGDEHASFSVTELLGRSQLLGDVGADVQYVEGFAEIVRFFDNPIEKGHLRPGSDYRNFSNGWRTRPYWSDGDNTPVAWKTATVHNKAPTIFAFVASSINAPPYVYPPPTATLSVNGKPALEFGLGIRTRKLWKNGDYAMEFFPKRIQTSEEGWNRWRYEEEGNSGIYMLSVPTVAIEAGQPVEISVQVSDDAREKTHQEFMIMDRKDVLSITLKSVAQEVAQLQADIAQIKRAVSGLARAVYPDYWPDVVPSERAILYTNGDAHLCSPELLRTKSGKYLLFMREGTEHGGTWGQLACLESRDPMNFDPATKRVVVPDNTSEPSLFQEADGTIFLSWFEQGPEKVFVARSEDDGATFSKPFHVENGTLCCSKMIQLDNGEVLAPWYSYDVPKVFLSKDKGMTWEMLYAWPKINSMFPEPSIAQMPSGRLACVVRYKADHLHISFSDDNGRSWTPPRRTPMTSQHHRGRLTVLSTGELLCTYGWRCRGSEFPGHQAQDDLSTVQVAVSLDEGQTWPKELMRFVRNDILNWDIGYPDTFELPDGKLYSLYWTNRFKRYFIIGHTYERWF